MLKIFFDVTYFPHIKLLFLSVSVSCLVSDTKIYSQLEPPSASLSKGDSVVLYLSKADLQKFGQLCGGIVHVRD